MNVVPAALFVAFLWGVAPTIHKHVLRKTDPKTVMVVGSLFYIACLAVFAAYCWKDIRRDLPNLTPSNVFWIAITSIIAGFVANLIYYFILRKHDSYVISALIYCAPVFTLVLSYMFLKERATPLALLGVLLTVAGVVCLSLNETRHHTERFVTMRYDLG